MQAINLNISPVFLVLIAIFIPQASFASQDQDAAIYCNYLESRVKKKWKSIDGLDDSAKYSIKLDKDGKVKSIKVVSNCKSMKSSEQAMMWLKSFNASVEPPVVPFDALVTLSNQPKLLKVEPVKKKLNNAAPKVVGAPGNPSKPTVVEEPDFAPYMMSVQRKLAKAWHPARGAERLVPKLRFKIHKNGTVSHIEILKSTGNSAVDKAAIKAVESAAPFSRLPAGSPETIDMVFSFNYQILKRLTGR